jgi:hypothetical protein
MIKIYDYITDLIENYISLDIQLNLFFIIEGPTQGLPKDLKATRGEGSPTWMMDELLKSQISNPTVIG